MPHDPSSLVQRIHDGFAGTPYPGDAFLQGSFDGCEPGEAVAPFRGVRDWTTLAPHVLDANYDALSFFSEGAFRFFMPAYMTADVRQELSTADPVFHLTGGFHAIAVGVPAGTSLVTRRTGGGIPLNPRRYGAITYEDHARFRLSVFSREECGAIVAYLRHRQGSSPSSETAVAIAAALDRFWIPRANHAPTTAALEQHVEEERRFLRSISGDP